MNINLSEQDHGTSEESDDSTPEHSVQAEQAPSESPAPTDQELVTKEPEASNENVPTPGAESDQAQGQPTAAQFHPTIPLALPAGKSRLLGGKRTRGLLGALAAILIVLALILVMPSSKHTPLSSNTSSGKSSNLSKIPSANSATTSNNSSLLSPGIDNNSLSSDLSNINTSMNQENTDQNSTTNALNDSSQQISVPTN